MHKPNKLNILIICMIIVFFLVMGCISTNNNPTDNEKKNITEYTKEDIEFQKKWHKLGPEDIIIDKSQTSKILEKFYDVQRELLLKNAKIKYNNYSSSRPFSDLINEFDPEFAKNPNITGILNENNIIIVHKKDIAYAEDINSPTENMLYLYAESTEPLLIIDDKTMLIKYANFGGYDYSYRNIEYIE
jgi:hypothetical protein